MEIFAAVFNEMKKELEAQFKSSVSLVRATETHTAWRCAGQDHAVIVVRDNETGKAAIDTKYNWFS